MYVFLIIAIDLLMYVFLIIAIDLLMRRGADHHAAALVLFLVSVCCDAANFFSHKYELTVRTSGHVLCRKNE